jgi:hypothetical protein
MCDKCTALGLKVTSPNSGAPGATNHNIETVHKHT